MTAERCGGRGGEGGAAGSVVAGVGMVDVTRPVSSGGIDPVAQLCLAAAAVMPFALIAAAHAWFAQQLKHGPDSIRG